MKKFLIVSLAVVCAAALVPQTAQAAVGVKGGFNLANISYSATPPPPFPFQNLQALTGGVFWTLNLGFVGFEADALYSQRGTKYEEVGVGKDEYKLEYVEVPLLAKFSVIPVGPIKPVIFGGASYDYLFKATEVLTLVGQPSQSTDVKSDFKKSAWNAVAGAGVEFHLGGILLSVEGRYTFGLSNINNMTGGPDWIKNKGFTVLAGIGF